MSFDSWVNEVKGAIKEENERQKQVQIEENERKIQAAKDIGKKIFEPSKKNTVFRKFSDNKNVKEIFPKNNTYQTSSGMDPKSHEGKVNTKGSIEGHGQMGREGDPINPDLRNRLEEKKRKDLHQNRPGKYKDRDKSYKRKSALRHEKQQKIVSVAQEFKDRDKIRKAIIMSELLAPPLSKRKNH